MKKLLAIVLTVMMLTGLVGAAMAEDKTEVTIWYYWETIKHQETLATVIADYNASQDQIEVKTQYVPFADFKKQLSIGATADVLPDIVIIDGPDHASYAAMGIFADLTDRLADWEDLAQYFEGPLDSCKLDDRLYGIPFGSNCLALFYNEDILAAAGQEVPTTWDELKVVAKATTKDNVSGIGFCSLQNEEGTFNFMPWVWSTGAGSFEIGSENAIRALTLVQDMINDGSMPKEAINWTQGDTMNQFISGNLAMMLNGPWQVPTMREQAPDLQWDVALIPVDTVNASALGGENFAVIAGGEEDAALDFLKYATSNEKVTSYIDEFGYIAARQDVAAGQFQDDPTMQVFSAQMASALPRGPHPDWPSISDAISLAFNQVIVGTMTPADAAAAAQATIDSILAE